MHKNRIGRSGTKYSAHAFKAIATVTRWKKYLSGFVWLVLGNGKRKHFFSLNCSQFWMASSPPGGYRRASVLEVGGYHTHFTQPLAKCLEVWKEGKLLNLCDLCDVTTQVYSFFFFFVGPLPQLLNNIISNIVHKHHRETAKSMPVLCIILYVICIIYIHNMYNITIIFL